EAVKLTNSVIENIATISAADLVLLKESIYAFVFDVLGLQEVSQSAANNDKLEGVIRLLIEMRNQARADKNWALSDQIRDQLQALGIQLKDSKEGTTFSY